MELRLTNGATVSRYYGGNEPSAELLAGFQYELDAIQYAKTKLAEDAERSWFDSIYIVTNHYNGKVHVFHHPNDTKKAA